MSKEIEAQDKKIASVARGGAGYGNISPELEALHLEMAEKGSARMVEEIRVWRNRSPDFVGVPEHFDGGVDFPIPPVPFQSGDRLQEPFVYPRVVENPNAQGAAPDFRTDLYLSDSKNDFPVVGFEEATAGIPLEMAGLEPTTWPTYGGIKRGRFTPVFEEHGMQWGGVPRSEIDKNSNENFDMLDIPKVPDAVFEQLADLQAALDQLTGADPAAFEVLQKKSSSGIEAAEKIAASAAPDFREEEPFLYGRPGVLPAGDFAPGQSVTPHNLNQKQVKPVEEK